MEYILSLIQQFADAQGINLAHIVNDFDRARLVGGMFTTIKLASLCIVCSVIIGVVGAFLQMSGIKAVRVLTQAYIQLFRNTPPLVQLYFFYFALSPLIRAENEYGILQPVFGNFFWAVLSLSFFAGAFNVEIFRSGIEAVPRTTIEAAEALGYTRARAFRAVTLPLAMRFCLPALTNNLVNLVKTTTLAYAIAVPETLFVANQIWSDRLNVLEMMVTVFAFYMILVGIVAWALSSLENSLKVPGFGR